MRASFLSALEDRGRRRAQQAEFVPLLRSASPTSSALVRRSTGRRLTAREDPDPSLLRRPEQGVDTGDLAVPMDTQWCGLGGGMMLLEVVVGHRRWHRPSQCVLHPSLRRECITAKKHGHGRMYGVARCRLPIAAAFPPNCNHAGVGIGDMPFVPPADSLYHRYAQAQRRFTWDRVRVPDKERTPGGIKVIPPERHQGRLPTCIYEAMMAWMESHLRLKGVIVRLSSKDLQDKEQSLVSVETDRTLRCMIVVGSTGVLSEDDYKNQNLAGVRYVVDGRKTFFSLNKEAIERAVETMHSGPLLLVFHCGKSYYEYIGTYKSKPILSYEKYGHEKMFTHAVNCIGYGVEEIVPSWDYQNSYGKKLGPRGRLLPQNAIRLYGLTRVRAVLSSNKRKRMFLDDPNADFVQPSPKKLKLEHAPVEQHSPIDWMDID